MDSTAVKLWIHIYWSCSKRCIHWASARPTDRFQSRHETLCSEMCSLAHRSIHGNILWTPLYLSLSYYPSIHLRVEHLVLLSQNFPGSVVEQQGEQVWETCKQVKFGFKWTKKRWRDRHCKRNFLHFFFLSILLQLVTFPARDHDISRRRQNVNIRTSHMVLEDERHICGLQLMLSINYADIWKQNTMNSSVKAF